MEKVGDAGLHIGVVGAGGWAPSTSRPSRSEGVSAVTLADADPAGPAGSRASSGPRSAATPEALSRRGSTALVIATATPGHAPLLAAAAAAGLPAFCEKPVALELAALDDAIAQVERAGTLVQIGFQRRFDAGYRAARDAVAAGALGRLLVLRAATHDPAPPAEEYIARSGGIFLDLHIHDFDAVRYVTGEEIVEVYADGAVRETPWFERHGDVDAAVAVPAARAAARSGSSPGRATTRSATTSGSRSSAPRTASPSGSTPAARSARSSPARRHRPRRRLPELPRALRTCLPRRARRVRRRCPRGAARARARSSDARAALARRPRRRPLACRAATGLRSRR